MPKISAAFGAAIAQNQQTSQNGDGHPQPRNSQLELRLEDFYAYSPSHQYIFRPTRDLWPAASVDSRIPIKGKLSASDILDATRAVEQMTWAPGLPEVIMGRLLVGGGWVEKPGAHAYNLYQPPTIKHGNATDVKPWLAHVERIYPDDVDHLIRWFAHRVQRPHEKVNHALVLGGAQGIGKDSLLEPVKDAVGPWNFAEIAPHQLLGRFNGFTLSVILRINEARDLGDVDRYSFYERTKIYTAAPPDVLRVDEKNRREYSVPNLCGVIITTNHFDGVYLPPDDRRHYVAWSSLTKDDFDPSYFEKLWSWFNVRGRANIAAYLALVDLSGFDAKAPPPKTAAWKRIVDAGRAPEEAELADVIDALGNPDVFSTERLQAAAQSVNLDFYDWLRDRKNRRTIPHRLQGIGYAPVRNDSAKDGMWKIAGKRQVVYGRETLNYRSQVLAVRELS